jgi:hypothetical protein
MEFGEAFGRRTPNKIWIAPLSEKAEPRFQMALLLQL